MGAAAQLHGEVAHGHYPDSGAVLLAEGGHRAPGLGLVQRQLLGDDGQTVQNSTVDQILHLVQLLGGDAFKVSEVETQAVRLHQRACLMDVVAQYLHQRGIQQVGGAVGAADGGAADGVNRGGHGIADL